ncbi:MAG: GNAT family N-acetyltransferase [Candidatus Taylorbacteria bacterium]|nr:GNAT family N-acetyltransferase [Candidatus Taylorbacteria bacterium]
MQTHEFIAKGIRFSIERSGIEVARAYLYVLKNDLHDTPFGLLEDVHVESASRGTGAGRELLDQILERTKTEKCYKLIATSRDDGTRQLVHDWYLRLGFRDYGTEFRMDFK